MIIKAVRHPKDDSPSVTVELTKKQLNAIYLACSELAIIRHEHFNLLRHPEQKCNVKMSVRHLGEVPGAGYPGRCP